MSDNLSSLMFAYTLNSAISEYRRDYSKVPVTEEYKVFKNKKVKARKKARKHKKKFNKRRK